MILLLFVASILVAVLLERQARQHTLERAIEYGRLGIPAPPRRPKLKRTEAWLNVWLGFVLVGIALLAAVSGFQMKDIAERMPDHAAIFKDDFSLTIEWGAFYLACGIALVWLGWKAIREISRYESGALNPTGPTKGTGDAARNTPPTH